MRSVLIWLVYATSLVEVDRCYIELSRQYYSYDYLYSASVKRKESVFTVKSIARAKLLSSDWLASWF